MFKYWPAFLLGVLTACAAFYWMSYTRHEAQVEALLQLSDRELVSRQSEVDAMDGLDGKIMTALLACAGFRMDATESKVKVESSTPAPKSAHPLKTDTKKIGPELSAAEGPAPITAATAVAASSGGGTSSGSKTATVSAPDWRRFFCSVLRDNPDVADTDPKWSALFPSPLASPSPTAVAANKPAVSTQGFLSSASPADLLKQRSCIKPAFWEFDSGDKEQSQFFQNVHGSVFEGTVTINSIPKYSPTRRMHLHFNPSQTDPIQTYWVLYQYDGKKPEDIFENRYGVEQGSLHETAWRMNTCSQSVVLLDDQCPWGSSTDYDLEYKDLFYIASTKQIAGNIYCRHKADLSWTQMGSLILTHTSNQ